MAGVVSPPWQCIAWNDLVQLPHMTFPQDVPDTYIVALITTRVYVPPLQWMSSMLFNFSDLSGTGAFNMTGSRYRQSGLLGQQNVNTSSYIHTLCLCRQVELIFEVLASFYDLLQVPKMFHFWKEWASFACFDPYHLYLNCLAKQHAKLQVSFLTEQTF